MSKIIKEKHIDIESKTKVGDSFVHFYLVEEPCQKSIFLEVRKKCFGANDRHLFCALTGESLKSEDGIYGVIGCVKIFPNCSVSKKLADELGAEEIGKRLLQSWTEAQEYKKKYRQWLRETT